MNHKPKKSLGQNFLQDEKALDKIVSAADLSADDNALEIGPGKGALSALLVERVSKVIMIEKDKMLAEEMARNFQFSIFPPTPRLRRTGNFQSQPETGPPRAEISNSGRGNVVVVGDVLEINLPELIEQNDFQDYKVVANIPYYITGKIIRLLFETKYTPKLIVLLVQKEVAERICSEKGKMSILSATVQFFGKPEIVDFVRKESFDPVPKVDSAILKITPFEGQKELEKQSERIFRMVKISFASRRKTLANNLAAGLQISKQQAGEFLRGCRLDENVRPQDLSIDDWKKLTDEIGL